MNIASKRTEKQKPGKNKLKRSHNNFGLCKIRSETEISGWMYREQNTVVNY